MRQEPESSIYKELKILLYSGNSRPLPINQKSIQNIPFYHLLFAALREAGFLPAEPIFANYRTFLASSGLALRLPEESQSILRNLKLKL